MNTLQHTSRSPLSGRPSRARRQHGITLIEMMVALAITTFVILVVNQLFNSVTETVSRGIQASELLQKASALDAQLAFESDLNVVDPNQATGWHSRMVGPAGRDGTGTEGGFLAIIQRAIPAPLTFEDMSDDPANWPLIRSDQLMFVYDQNSPLDAGAKRLPTMAPASFSFGGDQRDSDNADYVRMWYGHVLQLPEGRDPTDVDMANNDYASFDLGIVNSDNPNILAQDWVLGRHALFLTDSSTNVVPGLPYGPHTPYYLSSPIPQPAQLAPINNLPQIPNSPVLANGVCDVANIPLGQLISRFDGSDTDVYKNDVLVLAFSHIPLLTAAKQMGTSGEMYNWDYAPSHTYFMGGVSDFIVEFAGDLVTGEVYTTTASPTLIVPDGALDRDPDGRIKWYTAPAFRNHPVALGGPVPNPDAPVSYAIPSSDYYPPNADFSKLGTTYNRTGAAFIWQHKGTAGFTQWPWMIRIRYRMHDRYGKLEGRQVTDSTGNLVPESGAWYETIIPVNYQNETP